MNCWHLGSDLVINTSRQSTTGREVDPRFSQIPCLKNPRWGDIGRGNTEAAVVDRFEKALKTFANQGSFLPCSHEPNGRARRHAAGVFCVVWNGVIILPRDYQG